ncbi:MAG TPA: carbonic anhydrase [Candidatus Dojkabacteria bacterium]|nr:carbonic anhydrase [Candidatus Dojkabacteria bacterium]
MMHKAKAVVITCMDFRFHDKIQDFLKKKGYLGHCDEIVIAGASRDFVKPVHPEDGKYVWKQLGLSIKLHDPDEIIVIDHQDCGGYAQDGTIPGRQDLALDQNMHKKYLIILKKNITDKYPAKEISLYYAALNNGISLIK